MIVLPSITGVRELSQVSSSGILEDVFLTTEERAGTGLACCITPSWERLP